MIKLHKHKKIIETWIGGQAFSTQVLCHKISPKTQRIWSLFYNLSATSFMKFLLLLIPYYRWKNLMGKGPEINSLRWVALHYNSCIVCFFFNLYIYILNSYSFYSFLFFSLGFLVHLVGSLALLPIYYTKTNIYM